jgi:hypothetical protein
MRRLLALLLTLVVSPIPVGCAALLAYAFVETVVGSMVLLGLLLLAALAAMVKFHAWVSARIGVARP